MGKKKRPKKEKKEKKKKKTKKHPSSKADTSSSDDGKSWDIELSSDDDDPFGDINEWTPDDVDMDMEVEKTEATPMSQYRVSRMSAVIQHRQQFEFREPDAHRAVKASKSASDATMAALEEAEAAMNSMNLLRKMSKSSMGSFDVQEFSDDDELPEDPKDLYNHLVATGQIEGPKKPPAVTESAPGMEDASVEDSAFFSGDDESSIATTDTGTAATEVSTKNVLEGLARLFQQKPEDSAGGALEKSERSASGRSIVNSFRRLFGSEVRNEALNAADSEESSEEEDTERSTWEEQLMEAYKNTPGGADAETKDANIDEKTAMKSNEDRTEHRESAILTNFKKLFGGQEPSEQGNVTAEVKDQAQEQATDGGESSNVDNAVEEPGKTKDEPKAVDADDPVTSDKDKPQVERAESVKDFFKFLGRQDASETAEQENTTNPTEEAGNQVIDGVESSIADSVVDESKVDSSTSTPGSGAATTGRRRPSKLTNPRRSRASLANIYSPASTGNAAEAQDNKYPGTDAKAIPRKSSLVSNFKNVFEKQDASKQATAAKFLSPRKDDEKPNAENESGVKAVGEISKASNAKHLFGADAATTPSEVKDDKKLDTADEVNATNAAPAPAPGKIDMNAFESAPTTKRTTALSPGKIDTKAFEPAPSPKPSPAVRKMSNTAPKPAPAAAPGKIDMKAPAPAAKPAPAAAPGKIDMKSPAPAAKPSLTAAPGKIDMKAFSPTFSPKPKPADRGVNALKRMSKVSSVKYLFERNEATKRDSAASSTAANVPAIKEEANEQVVDRVESSITGGATDESKSAEDPAKAHKEANESPSNRRVGDIKALRRRSLVSSYKNVFETQDAAKQADAAEIRSDVEEDVKPNAENDTTDEPEEGDKDAIVAEPTAKEENATKQADAAEVRSDVEEDVEPNAENDTTDEPEEGDKDVIVAEPTVKEENATKQADAAEVRSVVEEDVEPNAENGTTDEPEEGDKDVIVREPRTAKKETEPRESAIMEHFKKFFGGRESSEQVEIAGEVKDQVSTSQASTPALGNIDTKTFKPAPARSNAKPAPARSNAFIDMKTFERTPANAEAPISDKSKPENSAREEKNVDKDTASPGEGDADKITDTTIEKGNAAPRESSLVAGLKMLFGGGQETEGNHPQDGLSKLVDQLDTPSFDSEDKMKPPPLPPPLPAQKLHEADATVMAATIEEKKASTGLPAEESESYSETAKVETMETSQPSIFDNTKSPQKAERDSSVLVYSPKNMGFLRVVEPEDAETQEAEKERAADSESNSEAMETSDRSIFSNIQRLSTYLSPSPATKARTLESEKKEKLKMLAEHLALDEDTEPSPEYVQVTVPPNVEPGQKIHVQAPNGQLNEVIVPPGMEPGSTFTVKFAEPEEDNEYVQVTVPPGVEPGQKIHVQAPNGQLNEVIVPQGLEPGSVFNVKFTKPEEANAEAAEYDSGSDSSSSSSSSSSSRSSSKTSIDDFPLEEIYDEIDQVANQNMEMREVLDSLEEAHRAIETLQEENKKLEEEAYKMKLDLEEAMDSNEVLKQKLTRAKPGSNQRGSSEEIEKLSATISGLKTELNNNKEERDTLVAQMNELQAGIKKKDVEYIDTFGTPTKLPDDFLQVPQVDKTISSTEVETVNLDDGSRADLATQLATQKSENEALKSQLTTIESELVEERNKQAETAELAEGEKADLEAQLGAQKSENEALHVKLTTMESQLMEERETQSERVLEVEVDKADLEAQLATARAELETLRLQLTTMETELLEESNILMQQLLSGKSENEALQAEVASLESQQAALLKKLEEELLVARRQNEELESQAIETETRQREETKRQSKVLEEKEQEITKLQNELSDLNEVKAAMDKPPPTNRRPSQLEMTALQVRSNRAFSDKEELEESLKTAKEEKEMLETTVESLEEETRKLKKNVARLEEENVESNQKSETLEAQLSEATEKTEQLSTKLKQQSAESAEREEKMSQLETSLAQTTEEKLSLEAKVSTLEEEQIILEGAVDSMNSHQENLEKANGDLTTQINTQAEERNALQEKLQQTEASWATDKKDLEATIAELKDLTEAQTEENQALHDNLLKSLAIETELASMKEADGEKAQKISDMTKDLDGMSADKSKLQNDYDLLSADFDALQQLYDEAVAEREALLASFEGKEKELEDAEKSAAAARQEVAILETQIAEDKENSKIKAAVPVATARSVPLKDAPEPGQTPVAAGKENSKNKAAAVTTTRSAPIKDPPVTPGQTPVAAGKENSKNKAAAVTTTRSAPIKDPPKPAPTPPVAAKSEPAVLKKKNKGDSASVSSARSAPTPTRLSGTAEEDDAPVGDSGKSKKSKKKSRNMGDSSSVASARSAASTPAAAARTDRGIPILPGMTDEDDRPVEEFRKNKRRSYIKRALNNRYKISTEEKLQLRKEREKNRERYKGMKQFFLGKKEKDTTHVLYEV